jgi:large exoprotein involved in heme utilization and adhesion
VILQDYGSLQTNAFGRGNSGAMGITSDYLQLSDGAFVSSAGFWGQGGNGGQMDIKAREILLSGLEVAADPFGRNGTGLITGAGWFGGSGGDLNITAEKLAMENRASIKSSTFGDGAAGVINIDVDDITLTKGSQILSESSSTGDAGDINISAQNLAVSGAHPDLFTNGITGLQGIAVSGISAQSAGGGGQAGKVDVDADKIELLGGGRITSDTFGSGNGGTVSLTANEIIISGSSAEIEDLQRGDPRLIYGGPGSGVYVGASSFFAETFGAVTGNSGDIIVDTHRLLLRENGILAGYADGEGTGGNILINVTDEFIVDNANIISRAYQANGGNISIDGNSFFHLRDSVINASVLSETGNGGNIIINAGIGVLQSSIIKASAIKGVGGNISLQSQVLMVTNDTEINASSEQSVDGAIDISSEIDIGSTLMALPDKWVDIASSNKECRASDSGSNLYYSSAELSPNMNRYAQKHHLKGMFGQAQSSAKHYFTDGYRVTHAELRKLGPFDGHYPAAKPDCGYRSGGERI